MSKEKNNELTLDGEEKVSRRKVIAASAALALGAAVTAALPDTAQAADGDPLKIGELNKGNKRTQLEGKIVSATDNQFLFEVENKASDFSGAIGGRSRARTPAVMGNNDNTKGGIGVAGYCEHGTGASGRSEYGTGVVGYSELGPGVQAKSKGRALDVHGKAYFSNSGTGYISQGTTEKTIKDAVLDKDAVILATLQGPAGPETVIRYAMRRSSTSFTVYLNKHAMQEVKFGWQVIN